MSEVILLRADNDVTITIIDPKRAIILALLHDKLAFSAVIRLLLDKRILEIYNVSDPARESFQQVLNWPLKGAHVFVDFDVLNRRIEALLHFSPDATPRLIQDSPHFDDVLLVQVSAIFFLLVVLEQETAKNLILIFVSHLRQLLLDLFKPTNQ